MIIIHVARIGVMKILYLPVNNGVSPVNPDAQSLMQRRYTRRAAYERRLRTIATLTA